MVRTVKHPDERRREILDAARRLFQTKEYEKASMQDIMEMLGIAKGTIYHYFKSKEELLEAVVEDVVQEDLERRQALLDELQGEAQQPTALDKLRVLLTRGNLADGQAEVLEALHGTSNAAMHTRMLAIGILKLAPLYQELVEQGVEEGIFHTEHPRECAEFLLAATQFLTDMGVYPWAPEDLMRRIRAFPRLVEAQLGAPKDSFDFLAELI